MKKNDLNPSLQKINYYLIIAGVCIIVMGFLVMATGFPLKEPHENSAFSFTKITLAPVLILLGYIVIMISIFYKKPAERENIRN